MAELDLGKVQTTFDGVYAPNVLLDSGTLESSKSGEDLTLKAKGWSNQNLLDNWYFGNADAIIDQRGGRVLVSGATYYSDSGLTAAVATADRYMTAYNPEFHTNYVAFNRTAGSANVYYAAREDVIRGYTGYGYTIDRWRLASSGSVLIKDGYLSIVESEWGYTEPIEFVPAGTYTLSCLIRKLVTPNNLITLSLNNISAGNISAEGDPAGDNFVLFSGTITLPDDATNTQFMFWNNASHGNCSFDLKAVKLELGTEQTLAHQDESGNWVLNDPPPNYQQELAKCQRYYRIVTGGFSGYGYDADNITYLVLNVPETVKMRVRPTAQLIKQGNHIASTAGVKITLDAISSSAVINSTVMLTLNKNLSIGDYMPINTIFTWQFALDANL